MMLSAGSILAGAFGLVRRQPTSVLVWGLLYFGATLAMALAMRPFANMSSFATGGDPQAAMAQMSSFFRYLILVELFLLGLFVALFAAPMRAVLRPADAAFFHLRIGMDELRLFALTIILIVIFYALLMVGVIVTGLVGAMVAIAAGPVAAVPVFILATIGLFGAFIWLEVRLSLVFPLTLLRRKIIIGESWRLTRGHFWPLFGAYLVLGAVVLVILSLAMSLNLGTYWSALAAAGDAQRAQAVQQQMFERMGQINAMNLIAWTLTSIGGALMIALFGGALATATRELVGDEDQLAETFA